MKTSGGIYIREWCSLPPSVECISVTDMLPCASTLPARGINTQALDRELQWDFKPGQLKVRCSNWSWSSLLLCLHAHSFSSALC